MNHNSTILSPTKIPTAAAVSLSLVTDANSPASELARTSYFNSINQCTPPDSDSQRWLESEQQLHVQNDPDSMSRSIVKISYDSRLFDK